MNGKPYDMDITVNEGNEVRRRYIAAHKSVSKEYVGEISLPENLKEVKSLKLVCMLGEDGSKDGVRSVVYKASGRDLEKLKKEYEYNLERAAVTEDKIQILGWAIGNVPEEFHLYDGNKEIPISVKRMFRKDVYGVYPELTEKCDSGLEIVFDRGDYKKLRLTVTANGQVYDLKVDTAHVLTGGNLLPKKTLWERIELYRQDNGLSSTIKHAITKLKNADAPKYTYMDFMTSFGPTEVELNRQRADILDYQPLMSIVIPMYKTPEKFLVELIDSIIAQTYSNWELCLADGSPDDSLGAFISKKYKDERIKYKHLEDNLGIAENTNAAIAMATGDYIVLSDHDDTLAPNAMYECVKKINEDRTIDVLYTDEDKISMDSKEYFEPVFKPDFNLDLLCSVNYICHLFMFRRDIYEKVGAFDKEFDGAQDHDFILRCCEAAENVGHVAKALYHWRSHAASTAMSAESKLYAFDAGVRAVQAHYDRMGIPAKVEQDTFYGTYRTVYNWGKEPLVSIIIPNKDHTDDLDKCIKSIDAKSAYKNIEYIIVENNSTEPETFEYYKSIEGRDDVKIVRYETPGFNFSAINNCGAKAASGEMFLLLNNDTEIINENCIKEMVDTCLRPDVGICGALLYYPDNTIQHAGVVMGIGGIAGHTFVGLERSEPGYMFRAVTTQDLSAVTAACLMVRRDVFEEVGGLTEDLAVAFNDVDFCMKVRDKGYLVVYNPHAELYHYESKSRGYEDTGEKVARFNSEVEKLEKLWPDILDKGDPYYNPNLSILDGWYRLKEE
ncbi:MAG: glycosyltransferase family 2 protein [Pseudobutyrivibrio sp.]|nr:glycosyltransferase family 2 protein [Pseudobutyrivibrio sp.]